MEPKVVVNNYISICNEPYKTPTFLVDGKLYPWLWDHYFISWIPRLLFRCPYRDGLQAKRGKFIPLITSYANRISLGMKSDDKSYSIDIPLEGTTPIIKGVSVPTHPKVLRRILDYSVGRETLFTPKLLIVGRYKGIAFSGRPDELILRDNQIVRVEEHKPRKWEDFSLPQILGYSYFLSKIFDQTGFIYTINSTERIFNREAIKEAEEYLDRIVDLLTGRIPCKPNLNFCLEDKLHKIVDCNVRSICTRKVKG